MKPVAQKLYVALIAAAVGLTGCTKKPIRPDPSATMMGPTPGGGATTLDPNAVATSPDANGLQGRGDLADANGQLRGQLGDPVYFRFDSSSILPAERPKLQAAKEYLEKNPTMRILLEGHCDWRGTAEYNLSLGDRRANDAKKYLVTLGVNADKIETVSKGSEEAKKNADEATMKTDRRVDLVVLKQP
jgi:peptidoglycan-associated lipoprotein